MALAVTTGIDVIGQGFRSTPIDFHVQAPPQMIEQRS